MKAKSRRLIGIEMFSHRHQKDDPIPVFCRKLPQLCQKRGEMIIGADGISADHHGVAGNGVTGDALEAFGEEPLLVRLQGKVGQGIFTVFSQNAAHPFPLLIANLFFIFFFLYFLLCHAFFFPSLFSFLCTQL